MVKWIKTKNNEKQVKLHPYILNKHNYWLKRTITTWEPNLLTSFRCQNHKNITAFSKENSNFSHLPPQYVCTDRRPNDHRHLNACSVTATGYRVNAVYAAISIPLTVLTCPVRPLYTLMTEKLSRQICRSSCRGGTTSTKFLLRPLRP